MNSRQYPILSRPERPVSDSFHDLIAALAVKLDEVRRCDVSEGHARSVGKRDIAALFARISSRDRHSIEELMQLVSAHQPDERVHSIFSDDGELTSAADTERGR